MSSIVLKPGRERHRNRHPWIFSGAIAQSAPPHADEVDVYSDDGQWQARALWSPIHRFGRE
jgi:23S rRNA G2069 N7-methylase RlmK/C1962 C5-methylase RlmI